MINKLGNAIRQRGSVAGANAAVFWLFLALVCLTGGASRHDALSLIVLRPIAVLACGYAIIVAKPGAVRALGVPFFLLLALAALMVAQLIPLPPTLWANLHGRALIAEIAQTLGLSPSWRPLTLTPARTWNSLFSLAVPAAILLLYGVQDDATRRRVPGVLVLIGGVSIGWGFAQLIGGPDSVFYHYRVHTEARPIGLFANRNHQAMFLAVTLFFAAMMVQSQTKANSRRTLWLTLLLGYVSIVVVFAFILGSRGGLLLVALAIVGAASILATSRDWRSDVRSRASAGSARATLVSYARVLRRPWAVVLAGMLGLLALGGLVITMNRGEAFDRLLSGGDAERFNRSETFPFVVELLGDHFPWGSGFGSFDAVFRQVETSEMLSTFYFNQAHNDWLQLGIEGGLPAYLILAGFLCWLALRAFAFLRAPRSKERTDGLLLISVMVAIGLASALDYPLRTPIFMAVTALVLGMIADRAGKAQLTRAFRAG